MNKQGTQFVVAVLGVAALATLTGVSMLTGEGPTDILVGGVIAVTAQAASWLFRLNGTGAR